MQPLSRQIGLKPTLRQMMIVILWSAFLCAAVRALFKISVLGYRIDFDCMMVPILGAAIPMPLLAILFWVFDRPGPVRGWYCACCMAAMSVLAATLFLLQDPICFTLTGRASLSFPMSPIVAAVCAISGAKHLQALWPKRCSGCGRQAVIAVGRLAQQGPGAVTNTAQHGWCAICGATYEREGLSSWHPKAVKEI